MSAPRWHPFLISVWFALTCLTFVAINSSVPGNWLMLLVFAVLLPAILLRVWNEDRPLLIRSVRRRQRPS